MAEMQSLHSYLVGNARVVFLASLIYEFGVVICPVDDDTFKVSCESVGESFIIPVTQFYAAVSLAHSRFFELG
jgi:hypothetical protein